MLCVQFGLCQCPVSKHLFFAHNTKHCFESWMLLAWLWIRTVYTVTLAKHLGANCNLNRNATPILFDSFHSVQWKHSFRVLAVCAFFSSYFSALNSSGIKKTYCFVMAFRGMHNVEFYIRCFSIVIYFVSMLLLFTCSIYSHKSIPYAKTSPLHTRKISIDLFVTQVKHNFVPFKSS